VPGGYNPERRPEVMTFSLGDVLLLLLAIAAIVLVIVLARTAQKVGRSIERSEETTQRLNSLQPQVSSVLEKIDGELADLKGVTEKTRRVAANVADVTDESRRVAMGLIHDLEELQIPERYRAAVVGARAGLAVLKAANRRGS
jgi:uncharacterized protein YoxC